MMLAALSVVIALATSAATPSPRPSATTAARVTAQANPDAAAQADFQARLQQYVKLRQAMSSRLEPLAKTANAAELTARQESLAAAIRDVRRNAKRGDLIPAAVAAQIARTVQEDFRRRQASTKRAVLDEVPDHVVPVVNKTLPDSAALATVPPLLLNNLPRLPDSIQYRFLGRHVILLDGDTRLIMDYVPDVLPPH